MKKLFLTMLSPLMATCHLLGQYATPQATPDALGLAVASGYTKHLSIKCKILQAVPGVGAMVSEITMVEHVPYTVAQPGYYDPLGNMGRGVQHYLYQTAYRDKETQEEGRIFIYGLTDPTEGTSWNGTVYTAGYCDYSDTQGGEHKIYMGALSSETASLILSKYRGECKIGASTQDTSTQTSYGHTEQSQPPVSQPSLPATYNTNNQFTILDATYGSGSVQRDVKDTVTSKIRNGTLNFNASSGELGGDPAFGQVKSLHIKYSLSGQTIEKCFRENERVQIP